MSARNLKSLRVAIIASSLRLGGAEKQTAYIARGLQQAGIELTFFYLGAAGPYETVLQEAGVRVLKIHVPNKPWKMLATLVGTLRQLQPQIVLAAQFGDLRHAILAGRICGALTLGGVRSDGFYELDQHGPCSRWMARLADGLIANSYRAKQNLVSRGIRPRKIAVLSNVIDLEDFDRRTTLPQDLPLTPNRIHAVAIGSLQPCKRFDRFLEALALARQREPALAGVIAGADCGARRGLESKARALGLKPPDLEFLGEVGNVPSLLARSAMLVLTSDYEGFPNVILEAMAARLPVIAAPAGDARFIVQDGKTGYVVDAGDSREMARFMAQLARSPSARRTMGEAGRKRVEQCYNNEELTGNLIAVFRIFASQYRRHSLCDVLERWNSDKPLEPVHFSHGVEALTA